MNTQQTIFYKMLRTCRGGLRIEYLLTMRNSPEIRRYIMLNYLFNRGTNIIDLVHHGQDH